MSAGASGRHVETSVAGETVRAFVPDPLPPDAADVALTDLGPGLDAAMSALARLATAGQMIPSLRWFNYAFVRREALVSSEIEGTQATLEDVLAYELTASSGVSDIAHVDEVANYVDATRFAFEQLASPNGLPVSLRLMNECHARLMRGVRGATKNPGSLRRSQNWIGGTRPGNAAFVPPPADAVPELLADVERYIDADDALPPLVRVALVHAQFETIHPYLDGNGRLGRMLIALLLEHWKLLPAPLLYLSLYLKQHQQEYYRRLDAVRAEGDWSGWLAFFVEGVETIATDATRTASALHARVAEDRQRLLASDATTLPAVRLFELLPEHPIVNARLVTELLSTTKPTAARAIAALEAASILQRIDNRSRDRLYRYTAYLRELE